MISLLSRPTSRAMPGELSYELVMRSDFRFGAHDLSP
jgi:hypothetical protein